MTVVLLRSSALYGAACCALLLQGCFAQAGANFGRAVRCEEQVDDAWTWGGHLATGVFINRFDVALEVDGRAENRRGSALTTGLQAGYTVGNEDSRVRFRFHLDGGLPLAWSATPSWYVGGTTELPIRLGPLVPHAEANRNYRFIGSHPVLVPYVRYRGHFEQGAVVFGNAHDVSGGLALRLHFSSHLL
jgi:hypothetical protein